MSKLRRYYRRSWTRTHRARLLRWYWWRLRRYASELCQDCGGRIRLDYRVPDHLWEAATGQTWERHGDQWLTQHGRPERECIALLCVPCLDRRATAARQHLFWTASTTQPRPVLVLPPRAAQDTTLPDLLARHNLPDSSTLADLYNHLVGSLGGAAQMWQQTAQERRGSS